MALSLGRAVAGNPVRAAQLNQIIDFLEGASAENVAVLLRAAAASDVKIVLADAAGVREFQILDSAEATVFSVDSDGNVAQTGTFSPSTFILPGEASPVPTVLGSARFDTDDFRIVVGNGAGQTTFYPGRAALPDIWTPLFGSPSTTAATALTANSAYLIPMLPLTRDVTLEKIVVNLGGSTDNIDVGVYSTTDYVTFTRVASLGSTAYPGTGIRHLDIADTGLTAGTVYYLAVAFNGTTATIGRLDTAFTPMGLNGSTVGSHLIKATSFPLPATIASPTVTGVAPLATGILTGSRPWTS